MSNKKGNKNKIVSFETKLKIVNDHFKNYLSFYEISSKYGISYSAARANCLNYQEKGEQALIAKKGNKINHHSERSTSIDSKDREIAKLRKLLKEKQLENKILKKLESMVNNTKK